VSLKNKWRKCGRFEARRETRRLHDGTPDGDVLYIRKKGVVCVYATLGPRFPDNVIELWANDGLYFRPRNAVHAGKQMRRALIRKLESAQ